jgi:hypothetical protein
MKKTAYSIYGDIPRNFTTAEANLVPANINDNSVRATLEHRFNDDWKFTATLQFFTHEERHARYGDTSTSLEATLFHFDYVVDF